LPDCWWDQNQESDEAIGEYELSLVPRSLFSADEQMLPNQGKSKLMNILQNLTEQNEENDQLLQQQKCIH